MEIDYYYKLTSRFIDWLREHNPGAVAVIVKSGFEPCGYVVCCRAVLDARFAVLRHHLSFPNLIPRADWPPGHAAYFDAAAPQEGDPELVLAEHPDAVCEPMPPRLVIDRADVDIKPGQRLFLPVGLAAGLGVRFVPVTVADRFAFMCRLETLGGEKVSIDVDELRASPLARLHPELDKVIA